MPQFRIPLLSMFKSSDAVPEQNRLLVSLCGVLIVLLFVAVSLRMIWNVELTEIVFAFIAMYLLLAILMIRSGATDDKSDSRNVSDNHSFTDASGNTKEGANQSESRERDKVGRTEGGSRC